MKKLHIWLGKFKTEKEFKKYLDQKDYLEAWSAYDNEPPTGDKEHDAEPNPQLRCDFCKEIYLDTYDEDLMMIKYYDNPVNSKIVADDICIDQNELEVRLRQHGLIDWNAIITLEDNNLDVKDASRSKKIHYIGNLTQLSYQTASDQQVHYLWIGHNKINKKNIIQQTGLDKKDSIKLNYHHSSKSGNLDEILMLKIEDYNIAEKMILKVDELKMITTNSILEIVVNGTIDIDGKEVAETLGMAYIGKFDNG
ncbi:immunity 22 family protein [Sphingobacterium sp. UBA5996]|uniref:immunity 22 family protein n=1 Tax=Sphingobacterium sp. UBA5996 TaxID=1947505 RepID=UPI0025D2AF11|nr:immunity 22 family protein [Sphingobacterium sp. UBA5996]